MLPSLHTRKQKADWEYVKQNDRTHVQRVAAATNGFLTPSNAVSIVGLARVGWSLVLTAREPLASGLLFIILARLADSADGFRADRTQTTTRVGGIADIAIDKLTLVMTLVILGLYLD